MKNFLTGLMLALILNACSSHREEDAESSEPRKQLPSMVNQQLEQAKGVEKQVFDSAERQKKQADDL